VTPSGAGLRRALVSRQRWALLSLVGVVITVVSAGWLVTHRGRPVDRGVVPAAVPGSASVGDSGSATPPNPAAAALTVIPSHLSIAALRVSAVVVAVAVGADGALGVPGDPQTLGWWAGGPLPGAAQGTTVFDGHVDAAATGAGALFELRRIRVGDLVTITGPAGQVRYRIVGVREYDKANLPATGLFTTAGAPRLALITCGGPFNSATHHYRDNIVALGIPA
jgi:hypothetical protein